MILAPGADDAAAMVAIAADPSVESVIRNVWGEALLVPNDPQFSSQWGLHNTGQTGGTPDADVDAPEAWNLETGNPAVVVAIIDTGIDYTHPDLAANMWRNPGEIPGNSVDDDGNGITDDVFGANFWYVSNPRGDPVDDDGHGTHVAGIVGAVGNNGLGVTGLTQNVRLMALKWLGTGGSPGTCAGVINAVVYAILKGADVINASWRLAYCATLGDAIDLAGSQGILFVAAAGNFGQDNDVVPFEPATFPLLNILAVASTDASDQLATNSNFGDQSVEVAAPGVAVLSTLRGGGFGLMSGTSMAAPHVSGMAAVILSRHPNITVAELKTSIVLGADHPVGLQGKVLQGARLNAFGALAASDVWAGTGVNQWVCDDGIDNDGDGLTDFPADPGCSAVFPDASEVNGACGLGFELAFLLPPLMALRGAVRRLRRRAPVCAHRAISSHTSEETSTC